MAAEFKERRIKKRKFDNHDFSSAEISNVTWKNCSFNNCRFENTIFKNTVFINCSFTNLSFNGCRFEGCQLAKNKGKQSGVLEQVQFENCVFVRSDFNFPIIRSCNFINNQYSELDFDGSRLYNCRFAGEMDAVEFRGHSVLAMPDWWDVFRGVDYRKYKNPMEAVDFREATFLHVGFSNGINLSKCLFPDGENGFLITAPKACFGRAKAIIENSWSANDKKRALHLIDTFLFTPRHESMPVIYFYKRPVNDTLKEFEDRLYNLLKKINSD